MKDYDLECFEDKDVYTWEEIIEIIEELISDKHRLEEELEDLKEDMACNYKKISYDEMYDINDSYFI
jgi:hypothetical protein